MSACFIDYLAADHSQKNRDILDVVWIHRQQVIRQHDVIGQLADGYRPLDVLLKRRVRRVQRLSPYRFLYGQFFLREPAAFRLSGECLARYSRIDAEHRVQVVT